MDGFQLDKIYLNVDLLSNCKRIWRRSKILAKVFERGGEAVFGSKTSTLDMYHTQLVVINRARYDRGEAQIERES